MSVQRETKRQRNHLNKVAKLLAACVGYPINDALVRSLLERVASPKPATLPPNPKDEKRVNDRIQKLCQRLGTPPEFIIFLKRDGPPKHDTFIETALYEVLSAFERSRRAVCRAQVCCLAKVTFTMCPQILKHVPPDEAREEIINLMEEQFWEHAESSYIRLAAFWDRVGQMLNFIYFNIRQSERDGFPAVAERIRLNYVPMFPELNTSQSWKAILTYMDSGRKDGMKWLLRRRNLVVHSLHLRSIKVEMQGSSLFVPEHDHLREKIHGKLEPGPDSDEIRQMHSHLSSASRLFEHVLGLCELGVRLRGKFLVDNPTHGKGRFSP